ncbi:LysR family transcriptional regulator (plasmid) [Photobacterium sp. GJ3]|uniref:LysR family transcriptional regulator n=1 Tax=Photobacterium sp. GJ3 TaxID=2829502 RepID=UPI001B8BABF9|nr:LysR family transcriptional regulator [Photobacterium sp. GJ3]QUJ70556.1 LysR family transcriptional regulator [Photobacterium sp. GJ3]
MLEQVETQWLQTFHAVYLCQSFKQAAEMLTVPTSNVSRHIALLESAINARLFERTTRRMTPTEAGHQLYGSTLPLLTALNDALEDVRDHAKSVTGQLKLLMPDLPVLAETVVSFCEKHPQLSLCCETSLSPKEDLLDGFDIVLSFHRGALADSGWVAKEVFRKRSCIVGSPALIARVGQPKTLQEIQQLPCITTLTALNGSPWIFKTADGKQQTLPVKSAFKVNSGTLASRAALAGFGFAMLAQEACQEAIESGRLVLIELEAEPEDLVLHAIYAGRKHLPQKIRAFLTHLENQMSSSKL